MEKLEGSKVFLLPGSRHSSEWHYRCGSVIGWGRRKKVLGDLKIVWEERLLSWRARMGLFQGIVNPTILSSYGTTQ